MALANISFVLGLVACLLSTLPLFTVKAVLPVYDPEVGDQSSFSYIVGAPDGPQNWGKLNTSWTLCGTGTSQSPINIWTHRVQPWPSLGDLVQQYQPAPAVGKRKTHEIEVEWTADAGSMVINETEYKLVQCHWHIPAEHTINEVRYSMELHAVHMSNQGDVAVVGMFYKLGQPDPFVGKILSNLSSTNEEEFHAGVIDPVELGFSDGEYYRYNGSLTTPPCSENVTWTMFKTVKTVSLLQLIALKNAPTDDGLTGNARPVQPLNGRPVYVYRPPPPPL